MKTISIIVLCLFMHSLHAQDGKQGLIVGSSGSGKTSTNETLTWTIGQPIIKTFSKGDVILSSGNQQTAVPLLVTAVENKSIGSLYIQAYPNPTQEQLIIAFNESLKTASSYDLISSDGKCVLSNTITSNNQTIDVASLLAGMYMLNVHINNTVQTFKIIKQ